MGPRRGRWPFLLRHREQAGAVKAADSVGENLVEHPPYSSVLTGAETKTEETEQDSRLAQPQREPVRDGQEGW